MDGAFSNSGTDENPEDIDGDTVDGEFESWKDEAGELLSDEDDEAIIC